MTLSSPHIAKSIVALNEELEGYVKGMKHKFSHGELFIDSENTITLVWEIGDCSFWLQKKINTSPDIKKYDQTIITIIIKLCSVCYGGLEHYNAGNTDQYFEFLLTKLEPWLDAYLEYYNILE